MIEFIKINDLAMTVLIICSTLLLIMIAYWIMPIKKMKEVNKALISLLQILPISKVIESMTKKDSKKSL